MVVDAICYTQEGCSVQDSLINAIDTDVCESCERFTSMCLHPTDDDKFFAQTPDDIREYTVNQSSLNVSHIYTSGKMALV